MIERADVEVIFRHEESHIKEGHTYDLLFVECIKIILWFNPILHLISRELSTVHEFQADGYACQGSSRKEYAILLLGFVQERFRIDVGKTFLQQPIKQRIHQLFCRPSSPRTASRLTFVIPVIASLVFVFSCASEFEVQTSIPNGKRVKGIKVIYHDEFGDVPEYDGATYSSVEFDRRGKIMDLRKGTFHENIKDDDLTLLPQFDYTLDNILWYLDYGFYTHNERYLAMGVDGWLENHLDRIAQYSKNVQLVRNEFGKPVSVSFGQKEERYEFSEEWVFTYNNDRTLASVGELRRWRMAGRDWEIQTTSRSFEYNGTGKLVRITENQSGINLDYDAEGKIREVFITQADLMVRRFEYTYRAGLRTHCAAFNKENQKEFTLDYLYSFF
jgi:YD repeat-containing protein